MTRNLFIFLSMFAIGGLAALVTRAAIFKPHAGQETPVGAKEYSAMVTNTLSPSETKSASSAPAAAAPAGGSDEHDHHHMGATSAKENAAGTASAEATNSPTADASKPVNTVCAICGMKVNASIPTAEYQGKRIGFGCRMCPPKFKADPDRYGPYYLRNETIKR